MECPNCNSNHHGQFSAEILIHPRSTESLCNPGVLVFPKILVCLACGFSLFIIPQVKVALMSKKVVASKRKVRCRKTAA